MEWWIFLILFFGIIILFMILGMPVFLSFLVVNILSVLYLIGFNAGMSQIVLSVYDSLATFSLTPIPFFLLMGEVLFQSGLVIKALDVLSKWFGRIPGRLSILSIVSGTLFASMSGSTIANTSMLGTTLVPDMRRRGYHTNMTVGPLLASGSLAMIIPPSTIAILLGSIGKISIGDLLIAGIIPGIIMAAVFVGYIIVRCAITPSFAPSYDVGYVSWKSKITSFVKHVLPILVIVIIVLGSIFFGVATPTESGALGALGAILIVACHGLLNKEVILKTLVGTLKVSGMIFMIVAFAAVFGQLLAYTGATKELITLFTSIEVDDIWILVIMLFIIIVFGCFLETTSIIMITLPLFMPVVETLGYDPIWFGILMLIALDLGSLTPPMGMLLFVMNGVTPKDITMAKIIKSSIPFVTLEFGVIILILVFPMLALWMPSIFT